MDLTTKNIKDVQRGFDKRFRDGYGIVEPWYTRLATDVPSTSAETLYGWMKTIPRLREWVGPRIIHNLETYDFVIRNKTFEDTIGINREAFEDDTFGVYAPAMDELGRQARKLPDDLITDLLLNGASQPSFDGQNFFDTDHPMGGGTTSNLFSAHPLTEANFIDVRQKMQVYKDDSGRPMGIKPNLLIVGPLLEITARKLVVDTLVAAGGTNTLANIVDILVIPELGDSLDWYLADTTRAIKPFVHQTRRAVRFVAKTAITDDNVFHLNQFHWGVDLRANAGFALWFLIAKALAA